MGSHSLLQWIFLTQGLNLGPLHCRQILYHLSHQYAGLQVWKITFYFCPCLAVGTCRIPFSYWDLRVLIHHSKRQAIQQQNSFPVFYQHQPVGSSSRDHWVEWALVLQSGLSRKATMVGKCCPHEDEREEEEAVNTSDVTPRVDPWMMDIKL